MPLSLSELLNPSSMSKGVSHGEGEQSDTEMPAASVTTEFFAPELFQSDTGSFVPPSTDERVKLTNPVLQEEDTLRSDAATANGNVMDGGPSAQPQIKYETSEPPELMRDSPIFGTGFGPQHSGDSNTGSPEQGSRKLSSSVLNDQDGESVGAPGERSAVKIKAMPGPKPKSKSASKNEGQHTDKRYLCYVCNKLFTRRRSVRDHISKIHGSKTWEPVRSLEIIVDPATGEPTEPLEKQLYKAAAKPPTVDEDEDQDAPQPDQSEPPEEPDPDQDRTESPHPPPAAVANLKTESSVGGSRATSVDAFQVPAPIIGKKRPAPASATKKGTAKVKNVITPHKKAKLTKSSSISDSPIFRSPSSTPHPGQNKLPGSRLRQQSSTNVADSPTPPASSRGGSVDTSNYDSADEEDEEPGFPDDNNIPYSAADTPQTTNSDGEVFCICRKGDNHTWMIACDGGCEEWYHGKCVDIRERDGDLIDKYLCPQCQMRGVGQTTWKRMCRRKGCRKPARVLEIPPSKYCSGDCGRKFFVEMVLKGDEGIGVLKGGQYVAERAKEKKHRRKVRRMNNHGQQATGLSVNGSSNRPQSPLSEDGEHSEYETDSSADDKDLPNRGGALRAGEVRAVADKCRTIEEWRELGKKPTAPPAILAALESITDSDRKEGIAAKAEESVPVQFDDTETAQLAKIQAQISKCDARLQVLEAKEQLLDFIKERSAKITEEVRKATPKMKDLCGFDPRLSWTEQEFMDWWNAGDGKAILDGTAKLGPPPADDTIMSGIDNGNYDGGSSDEEVNSMPKKGGVCVKNRCQRHGKWGKMQLAEVRFEQDIMGRRRERARREEEALRGRAIVKMWERQSG